MTPQIAQPLWKKEKVRCRDPSFPPRPSFIATFGILTQVFRQTASSKPNFQNVRSSLDESVTDKNKAEMCILYPVKYDSNRNIG